MASVDYPVPLAQLVHPANQPSAVKSVQLVRPASLERTGCLANADQSVLRVCRDSLALRVPPVSMVAKESEDCRDSRANREILELLEYRVKRDRKV